MNDFSKSAFLSSYNFYGHNFAKIQICYAAFHLHFFFFFPQVVEDELLYATVNHSAAGENFAPAVKYESGTDYATVVIH